VHACVCACHRDVILLLMCVSNKGMTYIVGPDWMDLFDVVITNARKPKFFNETSRLVIMPHCCEECFTLFHNSILR
jgi:hypothetical protein